MSEERKNLGRVGQDKVTGFSGTVTGYWISKTGEDRLLLESTDTTGRPVEFWVDLSRVSFEDSII